MLKLFLPCQIGSARLLHAATFTCKRSLCVALHVDDGPYDHCVCAARHDRQVELKWYWVEARRFVVLCEWCGTIHTCSMIFPWFSHDFRPVDSCRLVWLPPAQPFSAATSKVYVARMQDEAGASPKGFQDHCSWVISHVPIEHHPTIRYMVYNGYYKVMSNIPKMGHLPTPVVGLDGLNGYRTRSLVVFFFSFFLLDSELDLFTSHHLSECNLSKWWTAIFGRLECRITCSFTCSIWVQFQHCWHNLIEIKAPRHLGPRQKLPVICPGKVHCFRLLEVWGCPEQPQGLVIPDNHPEISHPDEDGLRDQEDIPMIFLWYSYGLGLHAMLFLVARC